MRFLNRSFQLGFIRSAQESSQNPSAPSQDLETFVGTISSISSGHMDEKTILNMILISDDDQTEISTVFL